MGFRKKIFLSLSLILDAHSALKYLTKNEENLFLIVCFSILCFLLRTQTASARIKVEHGARGNGRVVKASDSVHLMGILTLTRAQVQVAATTVHYVV